MNTTPQHSQNTCTDQTTLSAIDVSGHYAYQPNSATPLWLAAIPGILFGGCIIASWLIPKLADSRLPLTLYGLFLGYITWSTWQQKHRAAQHTIDADQDGLWLSTQGKSNGLVR